MAESMLPPVVVELLADIKEFKAKMGEAKGEMDSLEAKGASSSAVLGAGLGGAALAAGGLAAGIAGVSIGLAEGFQSAVQKSAGQLGLTTQQTKNLQGSMMDLAMGSEFTGTQLAKAYASVAGQVAGLVGGQNTAKASTDILKSSMELATATGQSLNTTTSDIATSLQAFQMPVSSASDVMAVLYNTTSLTGQSMDTITGSLQKMHNKLGDVAPPMGDMAATLVDMTQHGVSGGRALQTFSGGLDKILAPGKQTAATLQQLGVNVYDATGKFVGMQNLISQLTPKFAAMNQQQQISNATNLVGAGAASGLLSIIQSGPAAYQAATNEVNNHKKAQQAAENQSKTFKGELDKAKASVSNLATSFGLELLPAAQTALDWLNTKGVADLQGFLAGLSGKPAKGTTVPGGGAPKPKGANLVGAVADFVGRGLLDIGKGGGDFLSGFFKTQYNLFAGAGNLLALNPAAALRQFGNMGGNMTGGIEASGRALANLNKYNPKSNLYEIGQYITQGKGGALPEGIQGGGMAKPDSAAAFANVLKGSTLNVKQINMGEFANQLSRAHLNVKVPDHVKVAGRVGVEDGGALKQTATSTQQTSSLSQQHLPAVARMTDFTSQHTREANNHLMDIANFLKAKDTVNIKVKVG